MALKGRCELQFAVSEEEMTRMAKGHDVYLVDISINGRMSGVSLMRELKERPENARSKFVAFTAHDLPGQREGFLEAGFNAFLGKPFTLEELHAALQP